MTDGTLVAASGMPGATIPESVLAHNRMPKILVVEDNEMNRDMLTRRLARKGFDAIAAVDGQQPCDPLTEIGVVRRGLVDLAVDSDQVFQLADTYSRVGSGLLYS